MQRPARTCPQRSRVDVHASDRLTDSALPRPLLSAAVEPSGPSTTLSHNTATRQPLAPQPEGSDAQTPLLRRRRPGGLDRYRSTSERRPVREREDHEHDHVGDWHQPDQDPPTAVASLGEHLHRRDDHQDGHGHIDQNYHQCSRACSATQYGSAYHRIRPLYAAA
jgi:hypothetical protein